MSASNNLNSLYSYLIESKYTSKLGWFNEYKNFVEDIEEIRKRFKDNKYTLDDSDTYKNLKNDYKNKEGFLKKLFANKGNGIASNGQSVLSDENFKKLLNNKDFSNCIYNLILEPSSDQYKKLKVEWNTIIGKNNPVQTNRALAACTTAVTTTVDEGKFNQVYQWLIDKGFVDNNCPYESDWYVKNLHVTESLKKSLTAESDNSFKYTLHDINANPKSIACWINIFVWNIYGNIVNPFSLKKQVVKYGPPGTGKTFIAKQTATLQAKIWKKQYAHEDDAFDNDSMVEFVQFHPSYSYEDFIEGLRPTVDGTLKLHDGIFKSLCKKAGRWEVDLAQLEPDINVNEITIKDLYLLHKENKLSGKHWDYILNLYHQESDVQKSKKLIEVLPPYFLIIDEINRAELSRVFGELMYCLEYRGVKGAVKTQYIHLNDEETKMVSMGGEAKFFVPQNVYIFATMNTIDRSIESFDFALRRRFKWEEVLPNYNLLKYHLLEHNKKWEKLTCSLEKLNEAIKKEPLLGSDYSIGHAYLMDLPYSKDLSVTEIRKFIWNDSFQPLLTEYLRGTGKPLDSFYKAWFQ